MLAQLNPHPKDSSITFTEEGHRYEVHGTSDNILSCTTFIHKFFGEFDANLIVGRIVGSKRWSTDASYEYYKMTKEAILEAWELNRDLASTLGTQLHALCERWMNGERDFEIPVTLQPEYGYFLNWVRDHPDLIPYRSEWCIYTPQPESRITGSIDAIFAKREDPNELVMYDFKRSKEIKHKHLSGETGKTPFSHLQDCNFNHYCLQLNLYRVILQRYYGKRVTEMYLLVLHPSNMDYLKIRVPIMDREANDLLVYRHVLTDINHFSLEQRRAYNMMLEGKSMAMLGVAGSGKSYLIQTFVKAARKSRVVGLTATTGIASLLIGGMTIFKFLGIRLGNGTPDDIYNLVMKRKNKREMWQQVHTIIIDEVSMLKPELLDKLEEVARRIRRNSAPFGGIQMIFVGDWLQLGPVYVNGEVPLYAFDATCWDRVVKNTVVLTYSFRQNDYILQDILDEVRHGKLAPSSQEVLRARIGVDVVRNGILPTRLYPRNDKVEEHNLAQLNLLLMNGAQEYIYDRTYKLFLTTYDKYEVESLLDKSLVPPKISLCVGSQVMLTFNVDEKHVNGSRGVITHFCDDYPVVAFTDGSSLTIHTETWSVEDERARPILNIHQVPLKLAYALSVHKAQGCTLDCAEIDFSQYFACGQFYVALSRIRRLDCLSLLTDFSEGSVVVDHRVVDYYVDLVSEGRRGTELN